MTIIFLALACGTPSPAPEATPAANAPVVAAEAPPAPMGPATRGVDADQLKADIDGGKVAVLVDVRTTDEWNDGHVPQAQHHPLADIDTWGKDLPTDSEIYLICRSGGRSAKAAATLRSKGYQTVNVEGGTAGWIAKGYPTE